MKFSDVFEESTLSWEGGYSLEDIIHHQAQNNSVKFKHTCSATLKNSQISVFCNMFEDARYNNLSYRTRHGCTQYVAIEYEWKFPSVQFYAAILNMAKQKLMMAAFPFTKTVANVFGTHWILNDSTSEISPKTSLLTIGQIIKFYTAEDGKINFTGINEFRKLAENCSIGSSMGTESRLQSIVAKQSEEIAELKMQLKQIQQVLLTCDATVMLQSKCTFDLLNLL